jgi:tRNA threonylcarbamoyl adenosine modification protein (Sua5/YciO/YrdC/YwlC family)
MYMCFDSLGDPGLVSALQKPGAIGVIPTDTVYGVVCAASDEAAVARLYRLKARERKPGTMIAADVAQLQDLGIPRRYLTAVEQFWPGAVSIIIPLGDRLAYLHQGVGSLVVRVPDDLSVHKLLQKTGPLLTSSANQPGQPPATTITEAETYFGDNVDSYTDGGNLSGRQPSTIIKIVDDAVEVVRNGSVIIRR